MSLIGVACFSPGASVITIRRMAQTLSNRGEIAKTFTDVRAAVPVILEEMSRATAQQRWGQETQATIEATVPVVEDGFQTPDMDERDGVLVTSGFLSPQQFQVEQVREVGINPEPHILAALRFAPRDVDFTT